MGEVDTKKIMKQVFQGLHYLHEFGIGHRDIKLENIMLHRHDDEVVPKIIDFGLSKVFLPNETSTDSYGSFAFCSPEILLFSPHTLATDIWSAGIVLYYLLVGNIPFLARDKRATARNIICEKLNMEGGLWVRVSNQAKDILN